MLINSQGNRQKANKFQGNQPNKGRRREQTNNIVWRVGSIDHNMAPIQKAVWSQPTKRLAFSSRGKASCSPEWLWVKPKVRTFRGWIGWRWAVFSKGQMAGSLLYREKGSWSHSPNLQGKILDLGTGCGATRRIDRRESFFGVVGGMF